MKFASCLCFLFFCLLVEQQAVYAQTSASTWSKTTFATGRWQIGLRDGYGQGELLEHYNNLQAHAGYYVVDELLIGIGAGWSKEWSGSFAIHNLSIGPLVRYQFMRARFSPFIEASYQVGQRSVNPDWRASYPSSFMQTVLVSPGLSIGLTRSLRVDVSYGFQRLLNSFFGTTGQPQLGINYLFGGK